MKIISFKDFITLPILEEVLITHDGEFFELFQEGHWISGRFDRNIRIDQPTHGVGQTHAHIHGRNGNELGVINFDGTGSHGTRMQLHKKDATALRDKGADIRKDNIVEWIALLNQPQMLLG